MDTKDIIIVACCIIGLLLAIWAFVIWKRRADAAIESLRSGRNMPGPRTSVPDNPGPVSFHDTRPRKLMAQQPQASSLQEEMPAVAVPEEQQGGTNKKDSFFKRIIDSIMEKKKTVAMDLMNVVLIEVNPFVLSLIGGIAMIFIWLFGVRMTTTESEMLVAVFAGGLLTAILWTSCWKKSDQKKKDSKEGKDVKGGSEVPDGHLGIIEFFGMPIKFIVVTEGRLWLPPFFGSKSIDTRDENHKVPPTPKDIGFGATSSDGIPLQFHVSFGTRIDRRRLYHAIFGIKPGEAVEAIKDAMVAALRETVPNYTAEELLKNKDGCRGKIIGEKDEHGNLKHNTILFHVLERAPTVGLEIIENSVKIVDVDYANPKTRDALESAAQQGYANLGKDVLAAAIKKTAQEIMADSGNTIGYEEAYDKALIVYGQRKSKEIKFSGKAPEGVLTTVNTDDKDDEEEEGGNGNANKPSGKKDKKQKDGGAKKDK